jgi:predicted oxidoreductase
MSIERVLTCEGGVELSRLVYGTWRWDAVPEFRTKWGREIVESCLDLGISSFDHADVYGNFRCEEYFGLVLKESPGLRDRIEIVTKCGIQFPSDRRPGVYAKHYNTSYEHILESVNNSLRNFGTDYVDVLLIHRPDPRMNPSETARGLQAVVDSGKVRAVGVSNFLPWQLDSLAKFLKIPLVTNQVELGVLHLKPFHDGTIAQSQKLGFRAMAWSPLGGGRLFNGDDEQSLRVYGVLDSLAQKYDSTQGQVAMAWLLDHPAGVIPLLGTNKVERIKELAESIQVKLELQDWYTIWEASAGVELP